MSQQSHTPTNVPIVPRNREYNITECLSRDWFDSHAFKTAWFNAMSITFPVGEKFFIDSVRHFADSVEDPKLIEDIRGFCGQEGFHRREHERYNQALCNARGYDLEYLEGRIIKNTEMAKSLLSPIEQLAATAALEHITAIMAESSLNGDSPMIDTVEEPMKQLWDWHAAEEMEHKAVAFDVYRAMGGTEKMRKTALRRATFFLMFDIIVGVVHMLRRDGKLWSLRLWGQGWKFLFFKGGILRRVWPAYKEYFHDGFHPWQRDTQPLLKQWQAQQQEGLAFEST
ncbi:MAG: metal-dependent hydrolase [Halioglobus sp.]